MNNQPVAQDTEIFEIFPVGHVRRDEGKTYIEILEPYAPALKELERFSHVQVLWWSSEFQDDVYRGIMQSEHAPYDAPTLGMFACRSPVRPNPIGLSTSKILNVDHDAGVVEIASIDTFDDTPVLDLKPYIPVYDRLKDVGVPYWASDWPEWAPDEGPKLEE